jgi:DNA-binding response OmpR family regulator
MTFLSYRTEIAQTQGLHDTPEAPCSFSVKMSGGNLKDKLRVLVVDDEWPISESLALILTHHGFIAKPVQSGERAIELAGVFLPDVLISDVVLGGITGIEAANEILMLLPDCKVILFSGQANTVDMLRTSKYEVLSKPVAPELLVERIAALA